ncbi:sensor histidine kinase [Pseudonocardia sp. GCM10023141]|uniref:sensor histidine kinase n=1 Tax=Pseudonocardia sp. GCM10023141 TaxID=3252653 RepID=UPI00360A0B8F
MLRWVRRRYGLVIELLGYGFWYLIDVVAAVGGGSVLGLVAGAAVAAIALLRWRQNTDVARIAPIAIGTSLLFSAFAAATTLDPRLNLLFGYSTFTEMSFTEQLALALLVIAVLRRSEMRTALLLTGAAAIAIVGSPIARVGDSTYEVLGVLSALGWGGAVAIGLALREIETRRRATLDDVRSAERMELARELHDVVAHHVTGIVVAAQAAAVVARKSPDDVDRALAAIEVAGTDALSAMRRMVGVLRGQDSDGARTPGAELGELPTLVQRFDPDSRLVRLLIDPGLEHAVLPAGVAATGYRVVQEALTNVRRHAPEVANVEVDVRLREATLLVTVRNDGVPAVPGRPRGGTGGFGLAGMAERVAALDGQLTAGPTQPGVWTVAARIPLQVRR